MYILSKKVNSNNVSYMPYVKRFYRCDDLVHVNVHLLFAYSRVCYGIVSKACGSVNSCHNELVESRRTSELCTTACHGGEMRPT
jgi:hypothetical protein